MAEIMAALAEGDAAALVMLVTGYGSHLEACVSHILGASATIDLVDELVHVAAFAVMDCASEWSPDSPEDLMWAEAAIRARIDSWGRERDSKT